MATKVKNRLVLGAHMSIAGGMEKAFEHAESIDCTCMQIFTKSNRQWRAKPITKGAADLFRKTAQDSPVHPVAVHASYLINVGAEKPDIEKKSIEALKIELQRCELLGIPYLVLHPGSAGSQSAEDCLEKIARNISGVLQRVPGKAMICIENMAGQGSIVGHTFEQLAMLRKNITPKKRIGFCFDTCHAFGAGYDLRTKDTYTTVFNQFDTLIGLEHLKIIHLNDSKKELGSRVDRHEEIGQGRLGIKAFTLLMNDPRFFDTPKILETPRDTLEDYARNIETLKSLLSPKTKKILDIL